MRLSLLSHRSALVAVTLLTAMGGAACSADEEAEPDVASLRLTVGNQTINVSDNGTVTGGPITLTAGGNATVTAAFLNAAGTQDPIAHGADFQLNATPASTATVTFARTGAFTGTLNGVAAGTTTLEVSLFHTVEMHADFGPFDVPVTVN